MDTLVYIHIPKTGGNTVNGIIHRAYWPDVHRIHKTKGEFDGPFFNDRVCVPESQPDVIIGHLHHGLDAPYPLRYATMLRNPIRRTISQYHYFRQQPKHVFHETAMRHDLASFMEGGFTTFVDNCQTRFISGCWSVPYGECDDDILQEAKQNLSKMIVGLLEQFDKSLLLLQEGMGWQTPTYFRMNKSRKYSTDLSPRDERIVKRFNHLDLALYEYGKALFREQSAHLTEERLEQFRAVNKKHAWVYRWRRTKRNARRIAASLLNH